MEEHEDIGVIEKRLTDLEIAQEEHKKDLKEIKENSFYYSKFNSKCKRYYGYV